MKKPIKYASVSECQTICLKHTGCVGCPLKLTKGRCAYYLIKRDARKTLSEHELEIEIEV